MIKRITELASEYGRYEYRRVTALYSQGNAVWVNLTDGKPRSATASFEFEGAGIYWIGALTYNGGLFDWIINEGTPGEICGRVDT